MLIDIAICDSFVISLLPGITPRQRSPRRGTRRPRLPSGPTCRRTDGRSRATNHPNQNILDQQQLRLRTFRQCTSQSHTRKNLSQCMNLLSYSTRNLPQSLLTTPSHPTPRSRRIAQNLHILLSLTTASSPRTPLSTPRSLPTLQSPTSQSPKSPKPTTPPSRNQNWRPASPLPNLPTSQVRSLPTTPLPTPRVHRRPTAQAPSHRATGPPSPSTPSPRSQTTIMSRVPSPLTGRRPVPVPSTTPLQSPLTGQPPRCTSRQPCTPPSSPPTTPLQRRPTDPPLNPLLTNYQVEVSRQRIVLYFEGRFGKVRSCCIPLSLKGKEFCLNTCLQRNPRTTLLLPRLPRSRLRRHLTRRRPSSSRTNRRASCRTRRDSSTNTFSMTTTTMR